MPDRSDPTVPSLRAMFIARSRLELHAEHLGASRARIRAADMISAARPIGRRLSALESDVAAIKSKI
jgi:hypothetical protein